MTSLKCSSNSKVAELLTQLKCSCGHDAHPREVCKLNLVAKNERIYRGVETCDCRKFTPVIPLSALIPSLRNGASLTADEVRVELKRQLMLEIRKLWEESKKYMDDKDATLAVKYSAVVLSFERKLSELEGVSK
jgi:hypothetical protein